jgi:hypothetical protein
VDSVLARILYAWYVDVGGVHSRCGAAAALPIRDCGCGEAKCRDGVWALSRGKAIRTALQELLGRSRVVGVGALRGALSAIAACPAASELLLAHASATVATGAARRALRRFRQLPLPPPPPPPPRAYGKAGRRTYTECCASACATARPCTCDGGGLGRLNVRWHAGMCRSACVSQRQRPPPLDLSACRLPSPTLM